MVVGGMLSESRMVTLIKNWLGKLLVNVGMAVQWLPKDIHILTWNLKKKTHLAGQRHLFIDFRLLCLKLRRLSWNFQIQLYYFRSCGNQTQDLIHSR